MSINTSGFRSGIGFDPVGLRKPNEGEFQAVYPGSQLPIPFKETQEPQDYELTLSDSIIVNSSDVVELEQSQDLTSSDSIVLNVADTFALEQEQTLSTSDSEQRQYADNVELTGEALLVASNALHENLVDVIGIEQIQALNSNDSVIAQHAENVSVEQEHNLNASDAEQTNESDLIGLVVAGEILVNAQDGTQAVKSDNVTLTTDSVAVIFKRRRVSYYVPPEEKPEAEEEPNVVYTLDISDGMVGCFTDTLAVFQDIEISAKNAIVKSSREGASIIKLEQRRRKRFVDEETILLMAA